MYKILNPFSAFNRKQMRDLADLRVRGRGQTPPSGSALTSPSRSRDHTNEAHVIQMPRHPGDIDLSWEQVREALRALEGSSVAVRVIERGDPEVLVAAFNGTLGALSTAKGATLFWPVILCGDQRTAVTQDANTRLQRDHNHVEDVGFYLRADRFQGGVGRAGSSVLAITQGPVLINIRRS